MQEKDPDGVREEVRFLIDTFDHSDGGMCIAAGNGIIAGTPFENIEAFLNEAKEHFTKTLDEYREPSAQPLLPGDGWKPHLKHTFRE